VTKRPRRALSLAVYGVSLALHVALAAGAVLAPKIKKSTVVAISLAETHKPPPKKDETPPPPPPPPPPVKAKAAPVPVAVADSKPAPATPSTDPTPPTPNAGPDAFADLGLTMGNGAGGMAVPVGARPVAESSQRETTKKTRSLAGAHADACDEPVVKAKLRGAVVKPVYTDEARTAQIEGVVRVEMTVDDQGNVISVKVLRGLGYGLDEAAIRAAKQMTFEPGTKCGKAAVTKLTVGMRFALQQ
jgi:periplasmic protein TonB